MRHLHTAHGDTVSLMLQDLDCIEISPSKHLCSADSDRLVTLCIAMVNGPLKNCQTFTY